MVAFQPCLLHCREAPGKFFEGAAGGPTETINRLVGIANGKNILFSSRQQCRQFNLSHVGILKLIDENEASAFPFTFKQRVVLLQKFQRTHDHVAIGAHVFFRQHLLHFGVDQGNLMAARYHFIIEQLCEVMAAPHARQG